MTDYRELVERMRAYPANRLCIQVADALEAQAKEIIQYQVDVNEALLDCKSLRVRIAVLEAALTDCADALEEWVDDLHARGSVPIGYGAKYDRCVAVVNAAHATLKGEK